MIFSAKLHTKSQHLNIIQGEMEPGDYSSSIILNPPAPGDGWDNIPGFNIFDPDFLIFLSIATEKINLRFKEKQNNICPNLGSIPCGGSEPWHYYY